MMFHLRALMFIQSRLFRLLYSWRFGSFGRGTTVVSPIAIEGAQNIYLAEDVFIAAQTCLAAMPHTGAKSCSLMIGKGCQIGRFNHIYATDQITLEEHVLTANGVYISDNQHDYRNHEMPIMLQPILQRKAITIGSGTWLGHNVCVMGASIGRNCAVGANSVVINDIPDYCVVVGAPARIIKRYDGELKIWRSTQPDGSWTDE